MLSKKLKLTENLSNNDQFEKKSINDDDQPDYDDQISNHFIEPFWNSFYSIEKDLNLELENLNLNNKELVIYNPIKYAKDVHLKYLKKYLNGPKKLILIGMNPGPNGMAQTGVPFGNIDTVRNHMQLDGNVEKPTVIHPARIIHGMNCTIEEPSGKRFWGLIIDIAGDLNTFSQQCFMHNFCPLIFYDRLGRNITPSELKGPDKRLVRDICLKYLHREIELTKPEVIVSVGSYVWDCLKEYQKTNPSTNIIFFKLPHPSPRSLNNQNWREKSKSFFEDNNLAKYLRNEIDE